MNICDFKFFLRICPDHLQSGRFIQAEHQVHILDGLTCRAFDEVVDCRKDRDLSAVRVGGDVAEIRRFHSFSTLFSPFGVENEVEEMTAKKTRQTIRNKGSIMTKNGKIHSRIRFTDDFGKKRDFWRTATDEKDAQAKLKELIELSETRTAKEIDAVNRTVSTIGNNLTVR